MGNSASLNIQIDAYIEHHACVSGTEKVSFTEKEAKQNQSETSQFYMKFLNLCSVAESL